MLNRQSVRRFSKKPVEKEKIKLCVDAARLSPSASNAQPWSVVIADNPDIVKELAHATFDEALSFNKFVADAPVIITLVIEKTKWYTKVASLIKHRDFQFTDHGIFASNFCLMAAELEIGTCMIGWLNEKKVKKILNIPKNKRISMLIAAGYPVDNYPVRKKVRKKFEHIVSYNSYVK